MNKSQHKPLTNKDKFEAIAQFVEHYIKVKKTGKMLIQIDMANGGITAIHITPPVERLFPVEAN